MKYSTSLRTAAAWVCLLRATVQAKTKLLQPQDLQVSPALQEAYPAFSSFSGRMYAGSLPMDHHDRSGFLQFWLYIPDFTVAADTLTIWFNGGPGCSSFSAGIFFELGPVTIPSHEAGWCCQDKNAPLVPNPYAWTGATTMLFVEQPIGVGFSRATHGTPPPANEDDVAADFDAFLQNFYTVFKGYDQFGSEAYDAQIDLTNKKLYLAGESYAGIFIPSIARGIYLNNKKDTNGRIQVPLQGLVIGNGKIDALTQDPAVIEYAYWHGLIDGTTREYLNNYWGECVAAMQAGIPMPNDAPNPLHGFTVRNDCGVLKALLAAAGSPNMYEYSTFDGWPAAEGTIANFYNDPLVQQSLNVPAEYQTNWTGCIDASLAFMEGDTPWATTPYIAQLLDEANLDVLIYSGANDIIVCTMGSEEALRKMRWSGTQTAALGESVVTEQRNAWTQAPRSLWVYNETYPAGYVKSYKNLKFVTVYNAGHMVPYNQPGPSLEMITRFLQGQSFHDEPLESFREPIPSTAASSSNYVSSDTMEANIVRENNHQRLNSHGHFHYVTAMLVVAVAAAFGLGYFAAQLSTKRSGYSSIQ